MEHDGERTSVALMPTGQSINLFVAVGALLGAALGGADLGPGNGSDIASTVFLKTDQTAPEAIARLRAATARLTDAPLPDLVDPDPVHEVGEPTVQGIALDGGITVSLSRPSEQAEDYDLTYEVNARAFLDDFEHEGFRFEDVWDWDFRDYDWWFLWACHAIVWGIRQYDTAKAAAAKPDEVAA
jgi:hypothetical protein